MYQPKYTGTYHVLDLTIHHQHFHLRDNVTHTLGAWPTPGFHLAMEITTDARRHPYNNTPLGSTLLRTLLHMVLDHGVRHGQLHHHKYLEIT